MPRARRIEASWVGRRAFYAGAGRVWRHPVRLAALVDAILPGCAEKGRGRGQQNERRA
jgi:hypothetical protein